jgi:hypothetical protein
MFLRYKNAVYPCAFFAISVVKFYHSTEANIICMPLIKLTFETALFFSL